MTLFVRTRVSHIFNYIIIELFKKISYSTMCDIKIKFVFGGGINYQTIE